MAIRPMLARLRGRPPRSLRLRLEPSLITLRAGGRARFLLRVENGGDGEQEVVVAVDRPGDGWRASLPVTFVRVPSRSASTMVLRIDAPRDAALGARATFRISAAGSGRPDRAAVLVVEAVVDAPAPD